MPVPLLVLSPLWLAASLAGASGEMGEPRLPPPDALTGPATSTQAELFGHHTLFVNFDGALLNDDVEDSRTNGTKIGFSGWFEPYGDGAKRSAVLQAVAADWEAYNMHVTQTRPADGDYVMTMVGPTNFNNSLGVALLDCNNDWTQNNVVYAFHSIDDSFSAAGTATTISQEVAHSYGLEHVDNPADIMNPVNVGGDAAFLDACIPIIPASFGIACVEQHTAQCGNGEHQNGHAELIDLVGTSEPDTVPPTVEITDPANTASFAEGESFRIEVAVSDDRGIARLTLYANDLVVGTDDAEPWGWDVSEIPAGDYAFIAEALDGGGNTTRSAPIQVTVDPAPASAGAETDGQHGGSDGDTDGGDAGSSSGGEPWGDDGSGGPNGGGTPADPAAADDSPRYVAFDNPSCSCQAEGPSHTTPRWAWVGLLVLMGVRRRSRRPR